MEKKTLVIGSEKIEGQYEGKDLWHVWVKEQSHTWLAFGGEGSGNSAFGFRSITCPDLSPGPASGQWRVRGDDTSRDHDRTIVSTEEKDAILAAAKKYNEHFSGVEVKRNCLARKLLVKATKGSEMGKDLGTYFVRITLVNGKGFIYAWDTAARFIGGGTGTLSPLDAQWLQPAWDTEESLISTIEYMFTEGNYSCDCMKQCFIDQAYQPHMEQDDYPCGEKLRLKEIVILNPAGKKVKTITTGRG